MGLFVPLSITTFTITVSSDVILNVVMLEFFFFIVMLSVIMLSVMAPKWVKTAQISTLR
jgi:hypothetical protein